MARIGFLFNHDERHQVAHSLPIAAALAQRGEHAVVLATGSNALAEHLRSLAPNLPVERLTLARASSRLLAGALERAIPANKLLLYRDNLDWFRHLDALVVSEKTSLLLKSRYGLADLALIHTRHGAGDRAIGFGPESAVFDLVLVAGEKIAARLRKEAGVDPARLRVVGYPKLDLHGDTRMANPFPDPSRPTVLYAPHPSPKLSSWYSAGPDILRAFARQDRYNLVFAPHVMLFRRRWTVTISPPAVARVPQAPPEALAAPHVLVDTGSAKSSDMSYTNLADVYIGDASSQVYEFLHRPRPVLHIDAHGTRWQGDPSFEHWQAGPVVTPQDDIVAAVDRAIATHADYLPQQRAMLERTFAKSDRPASERAADAIAAFLAER
ncbi:MAG: hypothetical protein WBA68_13575 [Alteraurantiacibacter sp.]